MGFKVGWLQHFRCSVFGSTCEEDWVRTGNPILFGSDYGEGHSPSRVIGTKWLQLRV